MPGGGPSIFDIVAAGLAVVALGEFVAARLFAAQDRPQSRLIASLLLWEGVAMVGSGGVWARGFGFVALIFASVNIFGGFLVTQRMLAMYKKKAK